MSDILYLMFASGDGTLENVLFPDLASKYPPCSMGQCWLHCAPTVGSSQTGLIFVNFEQSQTCHTVVLESTEPHCS